MPGVTLVSYGDMLRVPGSASDLFRVKAEGGDVRIAYSPMDAVEDRARESRSARWSSSRSASKPPRRPTPWRSGRRAREGLANFSMLVSHVLVPPAIRLLLGFARQPRAGLHRARPRLRRDGLLANTRSWRANSACPSWSAASSRWICWKPS